MAETKATNAIKVFEFALQRAIHFLIIYDILHNSRGRRANVSWIEKAKEMMRWGKKEEIFRIDGRDGMSLLLIRADKDKKINEKHFEDEYAFEVLRAAIVTAISALDKYMHDVIVEKCWNNLGGTEATTSKELRELKISIFAVKKAYESKVRPRQMIKKEIQDVLHREMTFQNVGSIEKGAKLLNIDDFWRQVAEQLSKGKKGGIEAKDVRSQLKKIVDRRNQIVHEADLVRKINAATPQQQKIDRKTAEHYVYWIKNFVYALDKVFNKK